MKSRYHLVAILLLTVILFVACGPSQEEQDATATANAADQFATQTAEAPTETPVPTETPTATPTNTPEPTNTPAPEPTAAGDAAAQLEGALPTLDDLPAGFQQLPPGLMDMQLGAGTEEALGPNAMFMNLGTSEIAVVILNPLSSDSQRSVFEQQLEDPEELAEMLGLGAQLGGLGETEEGYEPLAVEGIGEEAVGVQMGIGLQGMGFVYDVILFSRGDNGAVIGVMHLEDSEPEVDVFELARLIDSRLMALQ